MIGCVIFFCIVFILTAEGIKTLKHECLPSNPLVSVLESARSNLDLVHRREQY